MIASRGMGAMNPQKVKLIHKRDGNEPVKVYADGGLSEAAKENIAKLKEIDKRVIIPAMAEAAEKLKEVNIQQPTKKRKGGKV